MDQALPVSPDLANALSTAAPAIATPVPVDSLPAVEPAPSKEDFWHKAIHDQAASGKSILGFCHERGIAYGTFHRWKRSLSVSVCTETDSVSSEVVSAAQDSSKINSPEPYRDLRRVGDGLCRKPGRMSRERDAGTEDCGGLDRVLRAVSADHSDRVAGGVAARPVCAGPHHRTSG